METSAKSEKLVLDACCGGRMMWFDKGDPPHLLHAGEGSWLFKKYGRLDAEMWQADLRAGFRECMRVLMCNGTLIFKWNTFQLSKEKVEACFPCRPTFMTRQGKTYIYTFLKGEDSE